jgi:L-ascorbate metabolism protein UlaG (beta-lactamase superfamily)
MGDGSPVSKVGAARSGSIPYTALRVPAPRWLRRALIGLGGAILLFVLLVVVLGYAFSGPGHQGPVSDHFDGTRFHNRPDVPHGGFGAFIKWQRTRQLGPWTERDAPFGPRPPARVTGGGMRVTFVNHATVLIQQDGVNVLTDPIWSLRASPVSFAGPRRQRPPGLRFEDLPAIDAVVLSHNHYDHMDLATLRRLEQAHHPRFFCGLGNKALLERAGLGRVTELDWWQSLPLTAAVDLIAVPNQHFSNRGLFDRDRTLWLGYVLRGPAGLAYFAGDTGLGPHYAEIRRRLGAPRLAVLPIGAYRPSWFMSPVHQSPAQALEAHAALEAGTSVAIHFGTFPLGDDGQDEPPAALEAARRALASPPRFWVLDFGEGREVP